MITTVTSPWMKGRLLPAVAALFIVSTSARVVCAQPAAPAPIVQIVLEKDGNTVKAAADSAKGIKVGATLEITCQSPTAVSCADVDVTTSTLTELIAFVSNPAERAKIEQEGKNRRSVSLPSEQKPGSTIDIRFCSGAESTQACRKRTPIHQMTIEGASKAPATAATSPAARRAFCQTLGEQQRHALQLARGREDFTVILFDESGACYVSRQTSAEGDPMVIGYVRTNESEEVVNLELDPCATASAIPKVQIGADVSSLKVQAGVVDEKIPFVVEWFPPVRRCFGNAVGVKLSLTKGAETKQQVLTLKQYERYRATLEIGAVWSKLHQRTFGLRTSGDKKLITETSATERGPEYVAAVVLYGLPRYFHRPKKPFPGYAYPTGPNKFELRNAEAGRRETYMGRDPVNENGWDDRTGLLFGAGMEQPGRRFLVGLSVELLTGVNGFVAREFVRSPELNGFAIDDPFTGDAKDIPTQEHWRRAWVAGVAIDARYALALFGRK